MKGLFIPEITAEEFRNGCLESIEALMAEGAIYDIEYLQPCEDCYYNDGDVHAECVVCDKPLEQQPCEDCISREAVEKVTWEEPSYDDALNVLTEVRDKVRALPSVKPKFTDEEIQKMQELEQAQLDKAYELGKAESFEEWLSSFNTESATCCFTAVQQLKEKLNGKMD